MRGTAPRGPAVAPQRHADEQRYAAAVRFLPPGASCLFYTARLHYTRPIQELNAPSMDPHTGLGVFGIDVRQRALAFVLGDAASDVKRRIWWILTVGGFVLFGSGPRRSLRALSCLTAPAGRPRVRSHEPFLAPSSPQCHQHVSHLKERRPRRPWRRGRVADSEAGVAVDWSAVLTPECGLHAARRLHRLVWTAATPACAGATTARRAPEPTSAGLPPDADGAPMGAEPMVVAFVIRLVVEGGGRMAVSPGPRGPAEAVWDAIGPASGRRGRGPAEGGARRSRDERTSI
jgi:hypothetical protein